MGSNFFINFGVVIHLHAIYLIMKHIISILTGGLFAAITLTGCDSVSEDDRFVEAEIVPHRSVLIEEFTGQNCPNCPDGHAAIRDILSTLGDSVVPVSIHASNLALDPPLGLKTATGEAYYQAAGSPPEPTAVINKQTNPLQVMAWGEAINRLIMRPTPFTVKAEADVDGENYVIDVAFSSGEDFNGKLMVWILENDVIRPQLDHGTMINTYVHNHVFRAAATPDIWGDPVELKAHEPQYKTYTVKIEKSDYWVTDNLYAVAFLYNNDGVAQVTSTSSH